MQAGEKIIVALDTDDIRHACELIETLSPYGVCFKVGLELISAIDAILWDSSVTEKMAVYHFKLVRHLYKLLGNNYFRDAKLHDIPNTVAGATSAIATLNPKFLTIHASSGARAIEEAAKNKGNIKLLAVTVLTSLKFQELWDLGFGCIDRECLQAVLECTQEKHVRDLVVSMANLSYKCGADGIICSPQELPYLKDYKGIKVTPGIRPAGSDTGDQKRSMTPSEAIKLGADYLVIGRPITKPAPPLSPTEALVSIVDEIEQALEEVKNDEARI